METVRIGTAVLHRGDARAILPSVTADTIVTDPVWPNCPPGMLAGSENPCRLWADTMAVIPEGVRRR